MQAIVASVLMYGEHRTLFDVLEHVLMKGVSLHLCSMGRMPHFGERAKVHKFHLKGGRKGERGTLANSCSSPPAAAGGEAR